MNRAAPPPNANATVEGGVCGHTAELKQVNHSEASDWRQGLSADLLKAVADHRRSHPLEPLPEVMQRDLARSWLADAGTR